MPSENEQQADGFQLDLEAQMLIRHQGDLLVSLVEGVADGSFSVEGAADQVRASTDSLMSLFRSIIDRLRTTEGERDWFIAQNGRLAAMCETANQQCDELAEIIERINSR